MNGMDKREMIERALEQLWPGSSLEGLLALANRTFSTDGREAWAGELWSLLIDALADQAIVIECEVEHEFKQDSTKAEMDEITWITTPGITGPELECCISEHVLPPGKAIAIIMPFEEEK